MSHPITSIFAVVCAISVGWSVVPSTRAEPGAAADFSLVFQAQQDRVGDHRYTNYREPVVVRTNSDKLVVGVHAGNRKSWPERSGQDLAVRISSDNGNSWGPIIVAAEHGNFSAQSHGLVYDAQINRLFFLYVTYNWDYKEAKGRGYNATAELYERMHREGKAAMSSYLVYSDDEGETWSQPRDLSAMTGGDAHFGASEGRQLTVGEHAGRLIIAGGDERNIDPKGKVIGKKVGVWISDDHGESWKFTEIRTPADITSVRNISCEARVSELADGTLVYNMRSRGNGRQIAFSRDGGESWSETREAPELKASQCNGCTITLRDSKEELSNTLLFSVPSPGGRSEGQICASRDGGKTWPLVRDVVPGAFAYSALIQLDAETVGLFYEANHHQDIRFVALSLNFLGETTAQERSGKAPVEIEPPNVLFISLDDMNDWLGCYGGHPDAVTPNIDKLAKRGVRFTNAHCVSPICGPSRASVLTGMRPETTGVYHNKGTYIDYVPKAVTFPEHFRANGYRALAAGKINHNLGEPDPRLWDENGPDCGVLGTPFIGDELHTAKMTPTREIDRDGLKITLPANGGLSAIDRPTNTWDSFDWAPTDCPETDYPDRQIADWGVEQLSMDSDEPLLLALGFYKPHQPFFAPRKYFDLYDAEKVSLPPHIEGDLTDVPQPGRELATRPWTSGTHKTVTEHGAWQEAVHAYLATVSFADAMVGRVIEALDAGPHADNTWIILWSDHGWSLGEKEHWGKHVPWREGVNMPLIIVPPKGSKIAKCEPGSWCDAPVSLLDLYPTLVDVCGLPERPELEGRSLKTLMRNVDTSWDEAAVSTIGRGTHSVSTGDWRYIRYFDGSEELYDLKNDGREWVNLASDPEREALKKELASHIVEDDRFDRFVRWGRWKCVFPVEGAPMLFDYQGDFGISEQSDVASVNPGVVKAIQSYLKQKNVRDRRVAIPVDEPLLQGRVNKESRSPNFVFIVVDDAGYDDFGFTGCEEWETPRIDSIAEKGMIFTDGYVTASVCGPSRAGLITGRYQQSFGHEENLTGGLAEPVPAEEFGLPLEVPTLGDLLKEKGYATAAFGKWHLGEHDHFHPNERGFDHFVGFLGGHRSFWPLEGEGHKGHRLMENDEAVKTPEYLTDHLGKVAASFIREQADDPFFVYLAYNAVHSPLQAREEDLAALSHLEDKKRQVLGAMTLSLDRSVGHVLDALKDAGIEEDTVVVFTNDNGAATYIKTNNGGLRGRKGTVWEGGLRVPFCLSWPGMIKAGAICNTPVNTLDVGYTFCRLAGHNDEVLYQRKLDGVYLLDTLKGEHQDRELFWRRGNTAAVRQGDWKLITMKREPAFLFHVAEDRKETENVIKEEPERAAKLQALLSRWDESLPPPRWRKKASDSYDEFLLKYWNED